VQEQRRNMEKDNNECYYGGGVNYLTLGCMMAWMNKRGGCWHEPWVQSKLLWEPFCRGNDLSLTSVDSTCCSRDVVY
jgi:hypothetical protein